MTREFETSTNELATPKVARIAGGLSLGAGALAMLTTFQTEMNLVILDATVAVPWIQGALGVATMITGVLLLRGRAFGAVAGAIAAGALALADSYWLYWTFARRYVSLFGTLAPVLACAAVAAAAMSIGPCRRVTAAREKLADEGMGLGL